ncbi:hypothetical protein MTO96_027532 [Rhipicephalus appendiculatus]
MPPLPHDEIKVIVRPKGGLCIGRVGPTTVAEAIWEAAGFDSDQRSADTMCPNMVQNIMVISTPSQENADRYVTVHSITISNQEYEVRAYVAAANATCKGVIRGISLNDDPEIIERKIVNERNPLALDAKRIKKNGHADRALRRLPSAQLRIVRRHHHQVHPLQKENRRVPRVWKYRASLGRVSNA